MSDEWPSITLVVADPQISGSVSEIIRQWGGEVITSPPDRAEARKAVLQVHPDLVVIAIPSCPPGECATLLEGLTGQELPVILVLDKDEEVPAGLVREIVPAACILAPIEAKALRAAVACAMAIKAKNASNHVKSLPVECDPVQSRTIDLLNNLNGNTRHDILNKLTVILGYMEFVKEGVSDAGVLGLLSKMEAATQAIQRQITFTRAYQDVGKGGPAWHNLREVVLAAKAHVRDLSKIWEIGFTPVSIRADPLFPRVFQNLALNVLNHAPGATTISVTAREEEGDLVIDFRDNGPGVPDERKEKIFDRTAATTPEFSLYLSREVLALTGITIRETGRPGEGACFSITIPSGSFDTSRA